MGTPCPGNVTFDCLLQDALTKIDPKSIKTLKEAQPMLRASDIIAAHGTDAQRKEMLYKYDALSRNLGNPDKIMMPVAFIDNNFAFFRMKLFYALGRNDEAMALLKAMKDKDLKFQNGQYPQFFAAEILIDAGKIDEAIELIKQTGGMHFDHDNQATHHGSKRGHAASQIIRVLLLQGKVAKAEDFYNYLEEGDAFMGDPHDLIAAFARYFHFENTNSANKEKHHVICKGVAAQLTWPENKKPTGGDGRINLEYESLLRVLIGSYCFVDHPELMNMIDLAKMPVGQQLRREMTIYKNGIRAYIQNPGETIDDLQLANTCIRHKDNECARAAIDNYIVQFEKDNVPGQYADKHQEMRTAGLGKQIGGVLRLLGDEKKADEIELKYISEKDRDQQKALREYKNTPPAYNDALLKGHMEQCTKTHNGLTPAGSEMACLLDFVDIMAHDIRAKIDREFDQKYPRFDG